MKIVSIGAAYLDINAPHFPLPADANLLVNTETVSTDYEMTLGGSAVNFTRYCTFLGLETFFIGKTGNDLTRSIMESLFKKENITPALSEEKGKQTNINTNFVADNQKSLMISLGNANQSLAEKDVIDQLIQHISEIDYLYIGGAFKLKELISSLKSIVTFAKAKRKIVILDHGRVVNSVTDKEKNEIKELATIVDFYLPSKDEFLDLWGVNSIEEGLDSFKTNTVIVKDGDNGAFGLIDGKPKHFPVFSVVPINIIGAGDCFNAALISGIAKNKPLGESIIFANAAAALKISQTTFPTLGQIANLTKTQQNG